MIGRHLREPDVRRFVGASLAVGAAFVVFGLSFGVLAVTAGASVVQATVMSLLVYTGASQMSAVSVVAAGGSFGAAFGGAALLAARNAVYGVALSPVIGRGRLRRVVGAHFVIDETTAIATAESDPSSRATAFWVSGPILYASWCSGTLLGALLGSSIDPATFGLDAAFPVMFTAMLVPHLRTKRGRRAAAFGGVVTVALAPFMPVGLPVLVAAFGILFGVPPVSSDEASEETLGAMPGTDGAP